MTKVIIGSNGFIGKFIANELAREYTTLNIHRENSDLENSPLAPLNDQVDIIYCAGIPRSKRDDLEAKKINLKRKPINVKQEDIERTERVRLRS